MVRAWWKSWIEFGCGFCFLIFITSSVFSLSFVLPKACKLFFFDSPSSLTLIISAYRLNFLNLSWPPELVLIARRSDATPEVTRRIWRTPTDTFRELLFFSSFILFYTISFENLGFFKVSSGMIEGEISQSLREKNRRPSTLSQTNLFHFRDAPWEMKFTELGSKEREREKRILANKNLD